MKTTNHSTNAQKDVQTAPKTALVFGSNGAVGSEVLHSLLSPLPHSIQNKENDSDEQTDNKELYYYWDEIILIGRKFSSQEDMEDDNQNDNIMNKKPKVTKIQMPSLVDIDNTILNSDDNTNGQEGLLKQLQKADACFINVGLSHPHKASLSYWHSTDVEMIKSMAKLCKHLNVKYISLLSSIDADEDPIPFSNEELPEKDQAGSKQEIDDKSIGLWKTLRVYTRIKGLAEKSIIDTMSTPSSSSCPVHVSLFQPSNIVTKTYRYGLVDRIVFACHKLLDLLIPTKYHSVPVQLLGLAMVRDAERVLKISDDHNDSVMANGEARITRSSYGDFVRIAGDEYNK